MPNGRTNSNLVLESVTAEVIEMYGIDCIYVPRTLVNEDMVLGEDRLSKFQNAYPMIGYFENIERFGGQGAWASKFGLQQEQSAQFRISKRGWSKAVAQFGTTILPNRPTEGDLIYVPLNNGLFEIMFVDHQTPFYQLGNYYSYSLTIELFRYSSERMDTGIAEIDAFEAKLSTDTALNKPIEDQAQHKPNNQEFIDRAKLFTINSRNPFGDL